MGPKLLLILALFAATASPGSPAPSFKGSIKFPVDLYTADGARVEKGICDVEVKQEGGQYSLVLTQGDKPIGTVKGEVIRADASEDPSAIPLLGTQFLRSSADPVGTEAERHMSKTGLAQYQEETRDWKASLRIYRTQDQKDVLCLFEEREAEGKWKHIQFKLLLAPR